MEMVREIDAHVDEVGRVNSVLLQHSFNNPVKNVQVEMF